MAEQSAPDFIPDYLSDESRSKLRSLLAESEPEAAPLQVDEYLIRHWCETLEDGNPLYLDRSTPDRGATGAWWHLPAPS